VLEAVSDQSVLQSIVAPAETGLPLPWRDIDYARRLLRVKCRSCLSTLFDQREDKWGKKLSRRDQRAMRSCKEVGALAPIRVAVLRAASTGRVA
jgi:hypothetical protein